MIKFYRFPIILCLFFWIFSASSFSFSFQQQSIKENRNQTGLNETQWIAIVNGSIIRESTYNRAFNVAIVEAQQSELNHYINDPSSSITIIPPKMTAANLSKLKLSILDELVGGILVEQGARRLSLAAPENEIKKRLSTIKKNFPTEQAFLDAMEKEHITKEELRNGIVRDILIQALSLYFLDKETVTYEQIKAYFVSHKEDYPETKLEVVVPKLKEFLIKKRSQELFKAWLIDWRNSSQIEINSGFFNPSIYKETQKRRAFPAHGENLG